MKKQIGIIGLGKMGTGIARNLREKLWEVVAYNRTESVTKEIEKEGVIGAYTYEEFIDKLKAPKVIWIMVPAGDPTKKVINSVLPLLDKGDFIVDAANSFYKNTQKISKKIEERGINFVDCGVSGGPSGAREGACLMVGGNVENYKFLEDLFRAVAAKNAYQFFPGTGAGHFVKMVHNGIEYGIMQAIAEGFDVIKNSGFNLNLKEVAKIYNNKSVIESRLIEFMYKGFEVYGEDLKNVSGSASHSGEGEWTIKTAEELGVEVEVIRSSLNARLKSQKNPSFQGKIISVLRNIFGGHAF